MADGLQIQISDEAAIALLKSPEITAELQRRAQLIAAAAGAGEFEVTVSQTPTRARVSVGTADHAARHNEATARGLSSALDAGRG